jgi:hypothetical protein
MSHTTNPKIIHYKLKDCYLRFQAPASGASSTTARVTQLSWSQDATGVTNTINNMGNLSNTNIPLWVEGGVSGMLYAGLYTSQFVRMTPQAGLNADNVVVSIILPTGVAKLEQVHGIDSEIPGAHKEVNGVVFGIKLHDHKKLLVPGDFCYTDSKHLKDAIRDAKANKSTKNYGISVEHGSDTVVLQMEAPV